MPLSPPLFIKNSKNQQKKRQHISVLSLNTGFRSCTEICKNCFPI
nr:MAG TPA_asm: hypothetical protein [Bacteriophage sp.]